MPHLLELEDLVECKEEVQPKGDENDEVNKGGGTATGNSHEEVAEDDLQTKSR